VSPSRRIPPNDPCRAYYCPPMTESERILAKKRRAARADDRPGERCNAPASTWTPIVDHSRCEAKNDCVDVCPNDVFEVRRIDDEDYAPLGAFAKFRVIAHRRKTAYTVRADACRACGLCVVACPKGAISLLPP
jgi:4Fe-4S ferredoxin